MKHMKDCHKPFNHFTDWVEDFFNQEIDLDTFFGGHTVSRNPASNIVDEDSEFIIELLVAGYSKEDFKINLENHRLTISAEAKNASTETKYKRREFNLRGFQRSFDLPEIVNVEDIAATYKDGILYINIPKIDVSATHIQKNIHVS